MADLTCNIKIRDNSGPIWDTYLYILYGNTTMTGNLSFGKVCMRDFLWEPTGNHKKKDGHHLTIIYTKDIRHRERVKKKRTKPSSYVYYYFWENKLLNLFCGQQIIEHII